MATFFAASLESIKEGLLATYEQGNRKAKVSTFCSCIIGIHEQPSQRVILVGGLASSPYMCQQLVLWGQTQGLSLSRPDGPM
jgi:hypothetical protein